MVFSEGCRSLHLRGQNFCQFSSDGFENFISEGCKPASEGLFFCQKAYFEGWKGLRGAKMTFLRGQNLAKFLLRGGFFKDPFHPPFQILNGMVHCSSSCSLRNIRKHADISLRTMYICAMQSLDRNLKKNCTVLLFVIGTNISKGLVTDSYIFCVVLY